MSPKEISVQDLRSMIRDDPCEFIYARQQIKGIRGALIKADQLSDEGGFIDNYAFSITTILLDMPSYPKNGQRVDEDNVPYRIARVAVDEHQAGVQLDLQTAQA